MRCDYCSTCFYYFSDPQIDPQKGRKTERQKDRKTESQKDRKTERQKDRKTERQKDGKNKNENKTETEPDMNNFAHCRCLNSFAELSLGEKMNNEISFRIHHKK